MGSGVDSRLGNLVCIWSFFLVARSIFLTSHRQVKNWPLGLTNGQEEKGALEAIKALGGAPTAAR